MLAMYWPLFNASSQGLKRLYFSAQFEGGGGGGGKGNTKFSVPLKREQKISKNSLGGTDVFFSIFVSNSKSPLVVLYNTFPKKQSHI